eukprot:351335-Chlamydomonas_euryale.AAC.14
MHKRLCDPWSVYVQALSLLPGSHFDILQTFDSSGMPSERPYKAHMHQQQQHQQPLASGLRISGPARATGSSNVTGTSAAGDSSAELGEVVLVVFLGGITYSEISALRYLQSRPESTHRCETVALCCIEA